MFSRKFVLFFFYPFLANVLYYKSLRKMELELKHYGKSLTSFCFFFRPYCGCKNAEKEVLSTSIINTQGRLTTFDCPRLSKSICSFIISTDEFSFRRNSQYSIKEYKPKAKRVFWLLYDIFFFYDEY